MLRSSEVNVFFLRKFSFILFTPLLTPLACCPALTLSASSSSNFHPFFSAFVGVWERMPKEYDIEVLTHKNKGNYFFWGGKQTFRSKLFRLLDYFSVHTILYVVLSPLNCIEYVFFFFGETYLGDEPPQRGQEASPGLFQAGRRAPPFLGQCKGDRLPGAMVIFATDIF